MDINQKQKQQKKRVQANPLETLKGIGISSVDSVKEDLIKRAPKDIFDQLFGPKPKSHSGEIARGESLVMKEIISGELEKNNKLKKQFKFERTLRIQEKAEVDKKTHELRIQLTVLQEEILTLSSKAGDLTKEAQIAAMSAPIEPGVYHLVFFEKLIEFLKSFNKKIEEASVWLQAINRRAQKKNTWGARYKKGGAKYLLSGEHYLSRSAG